MSALHPRDLKNLCPRAVGVTTKVSRKKIPLNVPSVSPFHYEERAHKWKYVFKHRITDESNISNQYQSCSTIIELIRNVGLIRTIFEVGPLYPRLIQELVVNLPSDFNDLSVDEFHKVHIKGMCFTISSKFFNQFLGITLPVDYLVSFPTLEHLAEELTDGTMPIWPVGGQLSVASLTIKYVILHKIGISNWVPSTHASTTSTSLGNIIYIFGTGMKVNVGEFVFNRLLHHVDTFVIHISICFPRLLSSSLLSQHPTILTPIHVVGTTPRVISLSM